MADGVKTMTSVYERKKSTIAEIDNFLCEGKTNEAFRLYSLNFKLCSPSCGDCCGDWRVMCCKEHTAEDILEIFNEGVELLKDATQYLLDAKKEGREMDGDLKLLLEATKDTAKLAYDKLAEAKKHKENNREYYCEFMSNCKGGPYKRHEVWYEAKADVAVCKKCWGGEKPDFAE